VGTEADRQVKVLVTGATGFLGGALARRLHRMGWNVTAVGRNREAGAQLETDGIRFMRADLTDAAAMLDACRGQEIVFHSGALSSPWGLANEFYASNVFGTENVVQGCMENQVGRLVHVSTPSIYFACESRLNVREDDPLPVKPINEYARTKLLAERVVDQAHRDGLAVITIRPRAIFGPGDTTILPRLIDRLQRRRLRVIGDGQNVADLSYVENVVDALILCVDSPVSTLGQKYNITNGEPVKLWEMVEKLCAALGLEYPKKRIAYPLTNAVAGAMEAVYRLLPDHPEPPLTRYAVGVLAMSTTLDIKAARRDLGYVPRISNEEGFDCFVEWWKETHQ
jgi:nucleoside-diphosphate-sugar epimerase